jgi:hypothetical protein
MKKVLTILFASILLFSSCATRTVLVIDNQPTLVKPYGWANKNAQKRDDVKYELSAGSIAFSALFINTLAVPVWLTGWKLYTPVAVKEEVKQVEKK